jgi:hypothetical protein
VLLPQVALAWKEAVIVLVQRQADFMVKHAQGGHDAQAAEPPQLPSQVPARGAADRFVPAHNQQWVLQPGGVPWMGHGVPREQWFYMFPKGGEPDRGVAKGLPGAHRAAALVKRRQETQQERIHVCQPTTSASVSEVS